MDARRMLTLIDASPSPFHACASAAAHRGRAGSTARAEPGAWPSGPGRHFVLRGGSRVAAHTGAHDAPTGGFRIVGAHTDRANVRIKARADAGRDGAGQLGVEVYGG